MRHLVPIEIFESAAVPVVAVDTGGTVRYANRALADRFVPDGELAAGRSCWTMARLCLADGRPFCRRDCPLRRAAGAGRVPAAMRLFIPAGGAAPEPLTLLNLLVPPAGVNGPLLLHLLMSGDQPAVDEHPAGDTPADVRRAGVRPGGRLHLLTPRELDVLEGLAAGLDAVTVADRLAITLNTARNHIRSILAKLRVHRQLDAVLLLLGPTRASAKPTVR